MKTLTIREVQARLEERVDSLVKRFDKFEAKEEALYEKLLIAEKGINDISHTLINHLKQEKERTELSNKWKLAIGGTLVSALAGLIVQIVLRFL